MLSDGNLVMKNFVRDGSSRSYFTLLEPDRLDPVGPEVNMIPFGISNAFLRKSMLTPSIPSSSRDGILRDLS